MADRETMRPWWKTLALEERPGLSVLIGIVLIVLTLAGAAALSPYIV